MKDDLRLDRAFAETPPEIHMAIERAFERGKKDMKKRYKVTLAMGTAACLAILLAAALAAGGVGRVHTDSVAAPGLNAVPEESAEVYFTEQGKYYHSQIDCSGMQGARAGTEEEAWSLNKRPCPVCMSGEAAAEAEEWVFCTGDGNYYHANVHCSGMRGAREVKRSEAEAAGKKPCPVCLAGDGEALMEEVTPEPTPQPTSEPTEQPFGAEVNDAEDAADEPGLTPTPVPMNEAHEPEEAAPASATVERVDAQTVYYTEHGVYYHGYDTCQGMRNADMHTLSEAEAAGKQRCPTCLPGGEPKHMDLFRGALGLEIREAYPDGKYVYQTGIFADPDCAAWVLLRRQGSAHTSWQAVTYWQEGGATVLSLDVSESQDLEAIRDRARAPVAALCRADLSEAARADGLTSFGGLAAARCVTLRLRFKQDGTLYEAEQVFVTAAEQYDALWAVDGGQADLRRLSLDGGETWEVPEGTLVVK